MKSSFIADYAFDAFKLPPPDREHKFHQSRKWRIDYAYPEIKLAIEIEGGAFTRGRHTRPLGFLADMEKYNALTEAGWMLLRYQPNKVDFEQIKRVYDEKINELPDKVF
jgi:very-short-patch-repair endonuclease